MWGFAIHSLVLPGATANHGANRVMNASDTLNRITRHKISQAPVLSLLKAKDERLHDRVNGCGTWIHLREWLESGESRVRHANFCGKFLLCRACAARRSGKLIVAYERKVQIVQEQNPHLIPAMVTLTVKNGDDLAERIHHLKSAWKEMMAKVRKGRSDSGRHKPVEWNKVVGSIRAIEVTRSDSGWHPHAHVFCLLSSYLDQKQLSREWLELTGDSFVVGVTKCKGGINKGLTETLKYASKLTELEPCDVLAVHEAANGSRFTDPQGLLRGVSEPDIASDDDEGLSGSYRDFIALWAGNGYQLFNAQSAIVTDKGKAVEVAGLMPRQLVIQRQTKGDKTNEIR